MPLSGDDQSEGGVPWFGLSEPSELGGVDAGPRQTSPPVDVVCVTSMHAGTRGDRLQRFEYLSEVTEGPSETLWFVRWALGPAGRLRVFRGLSEAPLSGLYHPPGLTPPLDNPPNRSVYL